MGQRRLRQYAAPDGYFRPPQKPPGRVAVDANWIYVANSGSNSDAVFPVGSTDDAEPIRVIRGTNTKLDYPRAVTVDDNWIYVTGAAVDANWIYVANNGDNSVSVFPLTATGNMAPTRSIKGGNTGLNSPLSWFWSDIQLSKKKSFSFSLQTLSDTFSKELTTGQWNSIRKLVGDAAGQTIYWHVESWDGLGRHSSTEAMEFVLSD